VPTHAVYMPCNRRLVWGYMLQSYNTLPLSGKNVLQSYNTLPLSGKKLEVHRAYPDRWGKYSTSDKGFPGNK